MNTSARRLAPLLAGLAMIGPFSIDTFFPAFRVMGEHFQVSPAALQQTISVYLAVYSVMALFHGPLSDAHGRRVVILWFGALFAVASLGCALAPSFTALLWCRALQGVAAGAGLIIGRAIIRDRFDDADAQRLMANVTLIFGIAPAIAPVIGGWLLTATGDWRPLFGFLCVFSAAMVAWCFWQLPETLPPAQRTPFKPSTLARTYAAMLRDAPFGWLAGAAAFNFGALFLYVASAPALILDVLRLSERDFAWLFVPAIGGMMLGARFSGRLAGQRSPAAMMQASFRMVAVAVALNLVINVWVPAQLPWAMLPIFFLGIGIAIGFPTLMLLMLDRFPATRGAAASLQTASSLLLMSLLSGLLSPWVSHHPLALAVAAALLSALAYFSWRQAAPRLALAAGAPAHSAAA